MCRSLEHLAAKTGATRRAIGMALADERRMGKITQAMVPGSAVIETDLPTQREMAAMRAPMNPRSSELVRERLSLCPMGRNLDSRAGGEPSKLTQALGFASDGMDMDLYAGSSELTNHTSAAS